MAVTRSDKQVVRIFVTHAELANLLGNQAQAAGFITFAPTESDLNPTEEQTGTDVDGNPIFEQGWEVVFKRDTP